MLETIARERSAGAAADPLTDVASRHAVVWNREAAHREPATTTALLCPFSASTRHSDTAPARSICALSQWFCAREWQPDSRARKNGAGRATATAGSSCEHLISRLQPAVLPTTHTTDRARRAWANELVLNTLSGLAPTQTDTLRLSSNETVQQSATAFPHSTSVPTNAAVGKCYFSICSTSPFISWLRATLRCYFTMLHLSCATSQLLTPVRANIEHNATVRNMEDCCRRCRLSVVACVGDRVCHNSCTALARKSLCSSRIQRRAHRRNTRPVRRNRRFRCECTGSEPYNVDGRLLLFYCFTAD